MNSSCFQLSLLLFYPIALHLQPFRMLLHTIQLFLKFLIESCEFVAVLVDKQFEFFLFLAEASDLMMVFLLQL